ncbi:MAG TPA: DUF4440 domain-containing protein [Verrucomicrobiales bacterium]|nr:DUF4440 domain-containing protein [Verrucomicrobiales bacterium]HIL70669.1 DUF4440 domain-containing protein [Verrucomicrobiota bacterium]
MKPLKPEQITETRQRVKSVLEKQVIHWNEGKLGEFMQSYVRSGALRFASGDAIQRGWSATLQRYANRYPDRESMGFLRFDQLEIQVLSPIWVEVFGRYHLVHSDGSEFGTGLFTLLMQDTPSGWKILHDHTSTAIP